MSAIELKGKPLADKIKAETGALVRELLSKSIVPNLAIIDATDDPASADYARMKMRLADALGVKARLHRLTGPQLRTKDSFLQLLEELGRDPQVHAIFIERPLPKNLDTDDWISRLPAFKDVEGEHPGNLGYLVQSRLRPRFFCIPTTALACLEMLRYYNIDIKGKNAVIIGRSATVGKPVSWLLLEADATVTICHSKTENLSSHTQNADIIITAAGKRGLITADMVSSRCTVIDVGLTYEADGSVHGDVDYENVRRKVRALTPARGGIGPVTTALLLRNAVLAAQNSEG
ncbi:bifunctional 5,10-methylenetetrahydrofolate dehydrogenase/5,10-methenyltetrahydrofolate cyclohydrolase [bacterium]|nr:bifunctional 5,10-methylenetetrahydrofolate dehydrogenase/5,10-methenyltetrahydrofolate cyclohydrolase [bacterium]